MIAYVLTFVYAVCANSSLFDDTRSGDIIIASILSQLLDEMQMRTCQLTTIEVSVFPSIPLSSYHQPEPEFDEAAPIMTRMLRVTINDARLRMDQIDNLNDDEEIDLSWSWNGNVWAARSAHAQTTSFKRLPDINIYSLDCLAQFTLTELPTMAGRYALSALLEQWKLTSVTEQDSVVEMSLVPIGFEDTHHVQLTIDRQPHVRVLDMKYTLRAPEDAPDRGEIRAQLLYEVTEWEEFDDLLLPSIAYRDGYILYGHDSRNEATPQVTRVALKRLSYERCKLDHDSEGSLAVVPQPGDFAVDDRLRARYRLGENEIYLDGFRMTVDEPISEPIVALLLDQDTMLSPARSMSVYFAAIMVAMVMFPVCLAILSRRRRAAAHQ